jgi:hypothetical protein
MDADTMPVLAFAGEAVKNLEPLQQENPMQCHDNCATLHVNADICEFEGQTKRDLIIHNVDRTRSWKLDRNSFDMERIRIPPINENEEKMEDIRSDCFGSILRQHNSLSDTIVKYNFDDEESKAGTPKYTDMSARIQSQEKEDPLSSHANPPHVPSKNIMLLALGALGVVFGDIGTSPLYTIQTIFLNIPATPDNVIGAISSIFWLLNLTVTLKYVIVIMRADNRGEGGIMALTALASQSTQTLTRPWWKTTTMMIGDPSSHPRPTEIDLKA